MRGKEGGRKKKGDVFGVGVVKVEGRREQDGSQREEHVTSLIFDL